MKEKLIKMRNDGIRIVPSKFSEEELKELFTNTEFLGDVSFSEKCYNYINEIKETVKCKMCKEHKPTFLRISSGYRDFCSNSCKNKWVYNNTDVGTRISDSVKNYHKLLPKKDRREQQNKRLQTMIERNIISDPNDREDLYNYYREVWRYTNENNLSELENFDKRGRIEIQGTYQLDHMFSISEGFRQNILPSIIGNINNLKMIPSIENSSKKHKCSISKEELFERIDRDVDKLW